MHRNIILMDLRTYVKSLKQNGLLLLSGFYEDDVEDILKETGKYGLRLEGHKTRDGWSCLKLRKESPVTVSSILS